MEAEQDEHSKQISSHQDYKSFDDIEYSYRGITPAGDKIMEIDASPF